MIAFIAVMVLLCMLAVVIRLITEFFKEAKPTTDPVLVAAISTAVAAALPGARVIKVEEKKNARD